jgi:peptidoglycan/xylan/chitin deacetylase (PgdA/CDA1 family)
VNVLRRQKQDKTLAILAFHKIGKPASNGWDTWFYISETIFASYLSYLSQSNWTVIDHDTLLKGLVAPETLPERAVLLTFDDGYRSMHTVALPWLLQFGYPAVFFVPTDYVGQRNTFDPAEPEEDICDWDNLRELERQGVSIQSHSASHLPFSGLTLIEQEEELRRSAAALEAGLGKRAEVFSYPYGDDGVGSYPYHHSAVTSPMLRKIQGALQRTGYRAACLYGGGLNYLPVANAYRLYRVAMGPDTDLNAELSQGSQGSHDEQ